MSINLKEVLVQSLTLIQLLLTTVCNKSLLSHVPKMTIDFLTQQVLAKSNDKMQKQR